MKLVVSLLKLLNFLLIVPIVILAIYFVSSNFSFIGGYQSFAVQSGSMEPSIMTGDVIVDKKQANYDVNDVITFQSTADRIVTHRIMEVNKNGTDVKFATKGDANRSGDEALVELDQVIGKVVLTIPKMGYITAFSKTIPGLIILLLIPVAIFILDELIKIINAKSKN